jgi:hypothetical protein
MTLTVDDGDGLGVGVALDEGELLVIGVVEGELLGVGVGPGAHPASKTTAMTAKLAFRFFIAIFYCY